MTITKPTRQPLFDGARALIQLGYPPETAVIARHVGSGTVAMRSTIGEAAKWTIEESDQGGLRKRLWKPFQDAVSFGAVGARSVSDVGPGTPGADALAGVA